MEFTPFENLEDQESKYIQTKEEHTANHIYTTKSIIPSLQNQLCIGKLNQKRENKKLMKEAAGQTLKGWFNMPKIEMTDEVKDTIRAINLRNFVQKDKFFKKGANMKQNQYIQIGTIISGDLDSKDKRLSNAEKKRKLELELLNDDVELGFSKKKHSIISEKARNYSKRKRKLLSIGKHH